MAKLFYTLKEAAEKLKMAELQVRDLVSQGQIQEFRDRNKLMFKVDQVDLLAAGEEDAGPIPLAEPIPCNIFEQKSDEDGTSLLDLTTHLDADDTKLGQSLLEGLDDYRHGKGQVLLKDERPATTVNRFGHFTEKEISTLRTALMTLRVAKSPVPKIEKLLDEINYATAFGDRRRGFFSRLFGIR